MHPKWTQRSARGLVLLLALGFVAVSLWPRAANVPSPTAPDRSPAVASPALLASASPSAPLVVETAADAPPRGETPAEKTAVIADDSAFEQFNAWAEEYLRAPAEKQAQLLAQGETLALARREKLAQKILDDPKRALELAAPFRVRTQLPPAVAQHLEEHISARGNLGVVVSLMNDGQMHKNSRATINGTVFNAHTFGRRTDQIARTEIPLYGIAIGKDLALAEDPVRPLEPDEAAAYKARHAGSRHDCPVSGQDSESNDDEALAEVGGQVIYLCSGGHIVVLNQQIIAQEGGTVPTSGVTKATAQSAWTTGNKTLVYIIVRFSDQPAEPQTFSDATTMMNTVAAWFSEVSYGLTSMTPTITPCFVLPQNQAYYVTNGDSVLMSDARSVAASNGFDYNTYDLDAVRWNGGPGSYSCQAYVGWRGCWLKSSSAGVAEHEFGHNYGLWHSNFWTAPNETVIGPGSNEEYGDPFDVMGAAGGGTQHYNAYEKNLLGWIPNANVKTITSNGTSRLYSFDTTFNAANTYALKIAKDSSRNYWVDYRQLFASNKWLMSGVELRWSPYGGSTGSLLLDTTPNSVSGKSDSAVVIGRTFSDYSADIHITPIAKGGTTPESIDVVVNRGTSATDHPPVLSLSANVTSVATNTNVTFTATASDPDGDTLAYNWDFGDDTFGTNNSVVVKSWSAIREYVVRCTVSDMKGGTASKSIVVTVGAATVNRISGRVLDGSGNPVADVKITNGLTGGSLRYAFTDTDGTYTIAGLSASTYTVTPTKPAWTFVAGFTNPVTPTAASIDFTATETLFTVAGKVTSDGTTALAGALVSDGTHSEPTDSGGNYTLYGVRNGSYALSAAKSGYTLSPQNFTNPISVNFANVTNQVFYSNVPTYSITGEVTGVAAGTLIAITDGYRTTNTYKSGTKTLYSLQGVPAGTWTLRANLSGSSFTPSGWSNPLTVNSNQTVKNFSKDATTSYAIGGNVTDLGNALAGVNVSSGAASSTSDGNGGFWISGLANATYTLTPTLSGYTFSPASRSVTINSANSTAQNFSTTAVDPPPTVATAAAATPNPVSAKTTNVSVLGSDNNGEGYLIYTWSTTGSPPAAVTFSINSANAAKNSVATFAAAGSYTLRATIQDTNGGTVTSDVAVSVNQTMSAVAVTPSTKNVPQNTTQQFTVSAQDQFGNAMNPQPAFNWSVSGGGSISGSGLFTAGATTGGPYTVTATSGSYSGTASVTVVPPNGPGSGVLREWWDGIAGTLVSDLTADANYPNNPTGSVLVNDLFESPSGRADNYGTRMRGYFIAPVTGSYFFYIASDDTSQLWLSTDATPANKVQIANVASYTGSRAWTTFSSQKSAAISLVAGQRYYIEALQKEGTGGDNLAVGVDLPGGIQERPIPYHRLDPWVNNQVATKLSLSVQPSNTVAGSTISPAVKVTIQDAGGVTVSTASDSITLAIGNNPSGGTLSGTLSVNAVNGVATFSNLSINNAGNAYTLVATAAGLTGSTSSAFNITPLIVPTKLAFSVQPSDTLAGAAVAPAVKVVVQDSQGATVTNATDNVTLAFGNNPAGGTLSGTLSANAVAGVATFSNLSVNNPSVGYTLSATASGLTGATSNAFKIIAPAGNGDGLTAVYFDNMDLTGAAISRVDSNVNFNWAAGSPDPAIGADTFSARWIGKVLAQYSETYSFYINSGDGARLWINNVLLVDKWVDQNTTEWSGTIALTAGTKYDIKLEYYENSGTAEAHLSWSSTSSPKALIPKSQLFSVGVLPTVAFNADNSIGSESTTSVTIPVVLSPSSSQTVTVNYAVTGGSATGGGVDYTLASGVLTFTSGQTTQNISVSIVNDTIKEANETLEITLSNATNAILGTTTKHTYTINNDDNSAPVAASAQFSTNSNTVLTGTLKATDADGDLLTYSVIAAPKFGTFNLNSATGAFTYTPSGAGQDSLTFIANDGSVNSAAATVTIDVTLALVLTSGPSASQPTVAGIPIQFSCAGNVTVSDWTWSFGDGSSGSGDSPSHTYAAAGTFVVTVTAKTASGDSASGTLTLQVAANDGGSSVDSDGDGVSDSDELALGTNPHDPNSKPGGSADADGDGMTDDVDTDNDNDGVSNANEIQMGTDPFDAASMQKLPMTLTKFMLGANFKQDGRDSCTLSGIIPNVAAGFVAKGAAFNLDVGGAKVSFVLDAHGKAKSASGSIQLTLKPSKRNAASHKMDFLGGSVTFKAKITGDFSSEWLDEGIDPASSIKNSTVLFSVDAAFNGNVYTATSNGHYTAVAGKSGRFKK